MRLNGFFALKTIFLKKFYLLETSGETEELEKQL